MKGGGGVGLSRKNRTLLERVLKQTSFQLEENIALNTDNTDECHA